MKLDTIKKIGFGLDAFMLVWAVVQLIVAIWSKDRALICASIVILLMAGRILASHAKL